jgi:4-amino-4-deoxy-L-arabinose transferase-like glycosyltransferase
VAALAHTRAAHDRIDVSEALNRLGAVLATKRGFAALLLILSLFLFLPGQGAIPPLDRDESRFAQATRQMLETGDFVQIRFQDSPRNLQPAGIYWLQAASVSVFGDAEHRQIWPHRIVSWLAALCVAFLTWWTGALLFGANAGRIAGVLIASSVLLGIEAHIAKIDATLCLAILLAQTGLAKLYMTRNEPRAAKRWAALFWGALGLGLLLKGPIVVLVSGGTILALVLLERRVRWLGRLHALWGVPLMLAIAAPWYVAIAYATDGEFYRRALGYSVVGKLTGTHQSHGGTPGYHLALWPLMFWPGSLFAALAAPFVWRERKTDGVRFCIAWIVPAWLVFEFSGTKLPHYTLPLLPAFAALAGAWLAQMSDTRFLGRPRLLAVAAPIWLVCGAAVTVGTLVLQSQYHGSLQPLAVVLGGFAAASMLAVLGFIIAGRARAAVAAAALSAAIAALNNYQVVIPGLDQLFMTPRIASVVQSARPCPDTQVVSLSYHEPSLVFLLKGDIYYPRTAQQAADRVAAAPQCALMLIGEQSDPSVEENDAAFRRALAERRIAIEPVGNVEGYNYNASRASAVTIYRAANPAVAP